MSEVLSFGVVGLGSQGLRSVDFVKHVGGRITCAVASTQTERNQVFLDRVRRVLGVDQEPVLYERGNYEKMLKTRPDAMMFAVSGDQRGLVCLALARKIPVWCETPLAIRQSDARQIYALAARGPTLCGLNEQWSRLPNVEMLSSQLPLFGALRSIRIMGKGREPAVELLRIGFHLLAIAHQWAGSTTSVSLNNALGSLEGRVLTNNGIPIDLQFTPPYNINKCFIEFLCERGKLRLGGSLLQKLECQFLGGRYELIHIPNGSEKVRISSPADEDSHLCNPDINPSFRMFEFFARCLREGRPSFLKGNEYLLPNSCVEAATTLGWIKQAMARKRDGGLGSY